MRAVTGAALLVTLVRPALRRGVERVSPNSHDANRHQRESPSSGESGRLRGKPGRGQTAGALPEDDRQGPGEGRFYAQAMAPLSWKLLGSGEPAGYDALKPTFAVPPGPIVAMYGAGVSVAWSPSRVSVELNG